jgi:uncharacterized membrane protein
VTKFEFYLALHLIAIIVWLGGALALQIVSIRAQSATDPQVKVFTFRTANWIGQRFFLVSSIVVLATGLLMVAELDYSLGEPWISFGFAVIIASALLGSIFIGPESGRIAEIMEREGPESPEAERRQRRMLMLSRIELFFLFLVVADMVAKPGA